MNPNDFQEFQSLMQSLFQAEKEEPVVQPIPAEELFDRLDLNLQEEGIPDEIFYQRLRELVMSTPRTASNKFFNQLFGGRKSKAVLGDMLAVLLNNSMYTYKVAGPMVGVEKIIIRNIIELAGFGNEADGTIATGGSMSNFMAMVMARDYHGQETPTQGVQGKVSLYTSEYSHYSIRKNAALMGVGADSVRKVPADEFGKMIPAKLEEMIIQDKKEGFHPVFVNATAGTTVLGAFDPIDEIAAVCKRQEVWLHVDGAYCGAALYSKKYKHLLKGLESADSFSVNAHKMLGTPLTCSIIICQDKKALHHSFSTDADYLYQTASDEFNLGKTSFQCGRRNDALKFWTLWKAIGTKGLEEMVDKQFHLADIARDYIRNHPDYTLYSFDESISICFNYKGIDPEKLCTSLYEKAALMVGFGRSNGEVFVRTVSINSNNNEEDILNFFKTIESFVAENENLFFEATINS